MDKTASLLPLPTGQNLDRPGLSQHDLANSTTRTGANPIGTDQIAAVQETEDTAADDDALSTPDSGYFSHSARSSTPSSEDSHRTITPKLPSPPLPPDPGDDWWDADAYLRSFIDIYIDDHPAHSAAPIRLAVPPPTLAQLHAIGSLPQADGCRAASALFRAPVIHLLLGTALWKALAGEVRRGGEGALFERLYETEAAAAEQDGKGGGEEVVQAAGGWCAAWWRNAKQRLRGLRKQREPREEFGGSETPEEGGSEDIDESRNSGDVNRCAFCSGKCPSLAAAAGFDTSLYGSASDMRVRLGLKA